MEASNISVTFDDLNNAKSIKNHVESLKIKVLDDQICNRQIFSATELLNRNIEAIPQLLEPILPKVGLCGFAGSSDTGKSSWLRQLAISVSIGESEFLGFKLNAVYRRAIYVSTEDDEYAISYLLTQANKVKQLPVESFKGLSFIFDTYNLLDKLELQLTESKVDLIVIDAFTDLYGKSMNDTNQVRTFLNDYSQLAQKHKCLIIFLHHTGKRTEELAPSKHNLLGSQGFEAKMRLVIELRNDFVYAKKRHLCIVKGNYLPNEFKTKSYVMMFDDNLQFTMTEERIPFENLKPGNKIEEREAVKQLKEKGKTQAVIAKEMGISQATVSRILKE